MNSNFFDEFIKDPLWHNDSDNDCFKAKPPIWLYGIEAGGGGGNKDIDYSVDLQLTWKFNSNVFRLFSAILEEDDLRAKDFESFARKWQPFVRGTESFYKGNLFSLACKKVSTWTEQDKKLVGNLTKNEYIEESKKYFESAHQKIKNADPKLFIGTGLTNANEFLKLVHGPVHSTRLNENRFDFKIRKRILFNVEHSTKVFILPHLSGAFSSCLTSPNEIYEVGRFIRTKLGENIGSINERLVEDFKKRLGSRI